MTLHRCGLSQQRQSGTDLGAMPIGSAAGRLHAFLAAGSSIEIRKHAQGRIGARLHPHVAFMTQLGCGPHGLRFARGQNGRRLPGRPTPPGQNASPTRGSRPSWPHAGLKYAGGPPGPHGLCKRMRLSRVPELGTGGICGAAVYMWGRSEQYIMHARGGYKRGGVLLTGRLADLNPDKLERPLDPVSVGRDRAHLPIARGLWRTA
jgi:hypothetical protein